MITVKFKVSATGRMSNTKYHASGKPNWWVRIEKGEYKAFVQLSPVRGDQHFSQEVEHDFPSAGKYKVYTGVGPRDYGIRETDVLLVREDGTCEYNP